MQKMISLWVQFQVYCLAAKSYFEFQHISSFLLFLFFLKQSLSSRKQDNATTKERGGHLVAEGKEKSTWMVSSHSPHPSSPFPSDFPSAESSEFLYNPLIFCTYTCVNMCVCMWVCIICAATLRKRNSLIILLKLFFFETLAFKPQSQKLNKW